MIKKKDLETLSKIESTDSLCVTIYIPTSRAGNNQEDKIRFKNALNEAINKLSNLAFFANEDDPKKEAKKYLRPALELLENDDFWNHLSDGLTLFVAEDYSNFFILPQKFSHYVAVDKKFYLRKLLPLVQKNNKHFILALSQNEVRFFEGNETSITPIRINDLIPNGMGELIGSMDRSSTVQQHSAGVAGNIYHGQGSGKDDKNEELKKYFREIDAGLMEMLYDETAPLLIYSVDYQIPIYKEVSKYSNIFEEAIIGNPEQDDPVLIHERSWMVIKEFFQEERKEKVDQFMTYLVDGKASFFNLDIIPAAINGKVEVLFVDSEKDNVWGYFDEEKNSVTIHKTKQEDSICVLEKAAMATYEQGGIVYNIPMAEFPKPFAEVNAIYRY